MYDNLREKQYEKECQDGDNPSAPSEGVSADINPDPDSLHKVRERIVSHTRAWKALQTAGIEVGGDALKRVPAGFDPAHPFAEDLKLKDFYTYTPLTEKEVCAPDFLGHFTDICRTHAPLAAFLTKALELPW